MKPMTVNDLIAALQALAVQHNDTPIIVHDIVKGENYDICSVGAYPLDGVVQIEI